MAFTTAEIDNIANAALDYYIDRGSVFSSTIQDKPLLAAMDAKAKTFPGGKGAVSVGVKGQYDSALAGYTHNDTVNYVNPAKIKRAAYSWKEHHIGIGVTLTELKRDGISVVDSLSSDSLKNNRGREETALANLLEDKLEDMAEGYARGLNGLLWGDGTADAKGLAGIRSFVKDTPAAAGQTVGGIDQNATANAWWRNRVNLAVATTSTGDEMLTFLNSEFRQLQRFGGKPDVALCGSDFMDRLTKELRARGYYTQSGFARGTDIKHGDVTYGGLIFKYDPTMDDIGTTLGGSTNYSKRAYVLDSSKLCLYYMENEKMAKHSPARPHNQYVMYRALTTTGCLAATQLNCHGVYQFA